MLAEERIVTSAKKILTVEDPSRIIRLCLKIK